MPTMSPVSPKETTSLRIDEDLLEAMRRVKDTEGIPVTTQFEMAAREWLKNLGITVKKADRKRPARRKRPCARAAAFAARAGTIMMLSG